MAETLEQMLEPGERVVQGWRGGVLPDAWPIFAVLLTVLLPTPVLWIAWDVPAMVIWIYLLTLLPFMGQIAYFAAQSRATRTLLTDRRLLHAAGRKRRPVTSLLLDKITAIDWFPGPDCGTIKVSGAAEYDYLHISLRRQTEDLPAKLAEATGLPAPAVIAPGRYAAVSLLLLSGWVVGYLGFLISLLLLIKAEAEILLPYFDDTVFVPVTWLFLAVGVGVGLLIGAGLALIPVRFLLSARDFRLWLATPPDPGHVRPLPKFVVPAALRLGGLLYGRAVSSGNTGGAGHG